MKSIEKTDKSSPRTDFLSTNFTMTTQTINFSKISKDKISEYIELMREHQLNCVKTEISSKQSWQNSE